MYLKQIISYLLSIISFLFSCNSISLIKLLSSRFFSFRISPLENYYFFLLHLDPIDYLY